MNKIIDGKLISSNIKESIKDEIAKLTIKPKLVVIQVGNNEASNVYVKNKGKVASNLGMDFEHLKYDENIQESELIKIIDDLNKDEQVNGIIVQLPLPKHLDSHHILNKVSPLKDIDGLTDENIGKLVNGVEALTPCTPTGVVELLKSTNVELKGKYAVIVGRSNLVGKPLVPMLLKEDMTVTICHSKTVNLKDYTTKADVLIVAVGNKHLITEDMVKENAIIIDVGINRVNNKLYGDVDFENVKNKASFITPVPGGVGPMTIAMLMKNTLKSYKIMHKMEK